ncbi:hypothetical protein BDV93DRAFT_511355 [Ceratobasidium sp. AG-I]|nr:hypothetical protein BDV93DRAFT_511355 [Ceratobasidium sp. AG-I]
MCNFDWQGPVLFDPLHLFGRPQALIRSSYNTISVIKDRYFSTPTMQNVSRFYFSPEIERAIWILFHMPGTTMLNLDADTCTSISAYLARIHDQYAAFQNEGSRLDLACDVNILERLFYRQPEVTHHFCGGSACFHIGNDAGAALRDACQTLQRKMSRLANISFPQDSQNGRDVYSIYRRYRIQYPEEPNHLSDPSVFGGHYCSMDDLQREVLAAQRWCIFNGIGCDLLATRLDTANTRGFNLLQVRGSSVVRQAHNWFIQLQGAPNRYRVPV